jgi:hypothetical protein
VPGQYGSHSTPVIARPAPQRCIAFAIMPGEDPGLVVHATLPNMTFSRETANDRFCIRKCGGSMPPDYSAYSTALFINLPPG